MSEMMRVLEKEIYPYLPVRIQEILKLVQPLILEDLVEIRLRVKQPLLLVLPGTDYYVTSGGEVKRVIADSYFCTAEDIEETVRAICQNSFYALEEELRLGYITLNGGHRIGMAGQAIVDRGAVTALKNFSSLNIRLAREVKNCAVTLMPHLFDAAKHLKNTLIIAPPRCGKTTLLRDIIRNLSRGSAQFPGMQVGVVDERSEIAACRSGVMTNDLGYRVDVLDGCPKACGMLMLIRTMAPEVIVTDEIGREEDVTALEEALHAGVRVIASVHGATREDLLKRPHVNKLIAAGYFDCYIVLSDKPVIGSIREIV